MFLPSLFGAMHILLEACKITTSSNSFDFTCEGICALMPVWPYCRTEENRRKESPFFGLNANLGLITALVSIA